MRTILVLLVVTALAGCATVEHIDLNKSYNVDFGIITKPETRPLSIDNHTNVIPWKTGEYEPKYGAHVTTESNSIFIVHYQIYSLNPETKEKQLIENSPYWEVSGGLNKGAFLYPDFVGGVKQGYYLFAIYVDQKPNPIKVVPFQIIEKNN